MEANLNLDTNANPNTDTNAGFLLLILTLALIGETAEISGFGVPSFQFINDMWIIDAKSKGSGLYENNNIDINNPTDRTWIKLQFDAEMPMRPLPSHRSNQTVNEPYDTNKIIHILETNQVVLMLYLRHK